MVRAGVVLPSREALIAGHADAGGLIRVAERAEELGFDSVWIGDSLFHRPRFDPLTMLAAVAARTSRITVGTAVLIAGLRHPLLLAQAIGTLDRVAQGRLVLGVGAGWIPLEFQAVGVPFEQREGRLRETMRICRVLWGGAGEPVTSRYWELPPVAIDPKPVRPGGPPLWIGGAGPKALRNAGRLFDGWVPTSPTPEAFASGWAQVRAHAEEAGRDPDAIDTGVYLTINLTEDRAAGEAETSRYAEAYYGIPYEVMRKAQAYFVGEVPACVAWLRGFVDAGAGHLLLRFATLDPLPQLERAAELLPSIQR
jgi:probable F420-dependent oxidoreductase